MKLSDELIDNLLEAFLVLMTAVILLAVFYPLMVILFVS